MKRKVLSGVLAMAMVLGMTAGVGSVQVKADDEITLKVFSNLPDRKNGQGLVEQEIIDEYMQENPNVNIEVEALDEEAYKTKFKAYSMEGMPDVVSIWGQPAFLDEVLDAGVLAELNQDDYADYNFISGSLDGFMKDGKLYGLPRNTDVAGFYYNAKMFEDNGWGVPTTYDELLDLAAKINEQGIVPLAMDGGDGWPMAVYLSDILYKLAGYDYSTIVSAAISNGDFSNENISALKQMETVYLLTNGGPGNSTQFAANYLYQQAFKAFKYGYGNAIGVVFIIICLVTTVVLNTIFADREDKPAKAKRRRAA